MSVAAAAAHRPRWSRKSAPLPLPAALPTRNNITAARDVALLARLSAPAAERDRLWSHPDLLPTSEDLDEPLDFVARQGAADPFRELTDGLRADGDGRTATGTDSDGTDRTGRAATGRTAHGTDDSDPADCGPAATASWRAAGSFSGDGAGLQLVAVRGRGGSRPGPYSTPSRKPRARSARG